MAYGEVSIVGGPSYCGGHTFAIRSNCSLPRRDMPRERYPHEPFRGRGGSDRDPRLAAAGLLDHPHLDQVIKKRRAAPHVGEGRGGGAVDVRPAGGELVPVDAGGD